MFLSSGIAGGPDQTMEAMVRVADLLRRKYRFNGYIHMKVIPGADRELVRLAGRYADRLSVNIEIPSENTLKHLAPGKDHQSVYMPMRHIREGMLENREERGRFRFAPQFAPAGQSTQMIVGAGPERDADILRLASFLYGGPQLKRVFYSGFIPVNEYDTRLPALTAPPLRRENRLYQADWLLRLYQFQVEEIVNEAHPDLDLEIDPKLAWALRHPEYFPLDVNKADFEQIVRIPGVGLKSARRIVEARRHTRLAPEHLKTMGVVLKRARYFIAGGGNGFFTIQEAGPRHVRAVLTGKVEPKAKAVQLTLF